MKKIFIVIFFFLKSLNLSAQEINDPSSGKDFASNPGSYNLVIRIFKPIVDPGEKIRIEIYISGYGIIGPSKLAFYLSPHVFDLNNSVVEHGIQKIDDKIGFGGQFEKLDPLGSVVSLDAMFGTKEGERKTLYSDVNPSDNKSMQIFSETKHPKGTSPLFFDLTIRRDARPGPQSIQFLLTYFNGGRWETSSRSAQFTIRNVYQKNEGLIWYIGLFVAILAILTSFKTLWPNLMNMKIRKCYLPESIKKRK